MNDMVAKVDSFGRPAWLGLMVLGFLVYWPVGLAVLGFLLWTDRLGFGRLGSDTNWGRTMNSLKTRWDSVGRPGRGYGGYGSTGNRAFDAYRDETLRRLEDEAVEFEAFLRRLRMAKDKAEFDQFMAERRRLSKGQVGSETVIPADDPRSPWPPL